MFDNYEEQATGATYTTPDGQLTIIIFIVGYVDDARTSDNSFPLDSSTTLETLLQQAATDSQLWHDMLQSSNQALELSKCGFHVMEYRFEDDGKPVLINKPEVPPLQVQDSEGNMLEITQWENTKATKYLGCYECPANKKEQLEIITKKCKDFKRILQSSYLTSREAEISYWSIYRPSVTYPLPICTFTLEEL